MSRVSRAASRVSRVTWFTIAVCVIALTMIGVGTWYIVDRVRTSSPSSLDTVDPPSVPGPTPVPAPMPVPAPVPAPLPVPAPVPVPKPAPVPAPLPVPAPVPAPLPVPAPVPVPKPAPVPAPAPNPAPGPVPNPAPGPKVETKTMSGPMIKGMATFYTAGEGGDRGANGKKLVPFTSVAMKTADYKKYKGRRVQIVSSSGVPMGPTAFRVDDECAGGGCKTFDLYIGTTLKNQTRLPGWKSGNIPVKYAWV